MMVYLIVLVVAGAVLGFILYEVMQLRGMIGAQAPAAAAAGGSALGESLVDESAHILDNAATGFWSTFSHPFDWLFGN